MKPTENLKPFDSLVSAFEIEYPENSGEYHLYHLAHNDEYICGVSIFNAGYSVDFYIKKDNTFSIDEQLEFLYDAIYEALINGDELKGEIII